MFRAMMVMIRLMCISGEEMAHMIIASFQMGVYISMKAFLVGGNGLVFQPMKFIWWINSVSGWMRWRKEEAAFDVGQLTVFLTEIV